jgi:hypothetical protein
VKGFDAAFPFAVERGLSKRQFAEILVFALACSGPGIIDTRATAKFACDAADDLILEMQSREQESTP